MAPAETRRRVARVLLRSVFPVPEGPAKGKLAIGHYAFAKPLFEGRIALATALTASGCPTTLSTSSFSILSSFSFPVGMKLVTGMEVQRAMKFAICSGVTALVPPPTAASSAAFFASSCASRCWRSGGRKLWQGNIYEGRSVHMSFEY